MSDKLSKQFWVTVQTEFLSKPNHYICNGSFSFKKAWKIKKLKTEIKILEKKFLEEMKYDFKSFKKDPILFKRYNGSDRQIKLDFLEWIIKQII